MTTEASGWQNLIVPGAVATSWLAYASERGLAQQAVIAQAGLEAEQAASFSAGISLVKYLRLIAAVHAALGDDGVGLEVGWRMPPTTFGNLGQALLSSATLRNALQLFQRFWPLVARGFVLDVALHEGRGVLSFFTLFPADGALRRIALETIMVSLYRGLTLLAPDVADGVEVWFDYPEPDYGERIRARIPRVRFGMPRLQSSFPESLLDTPLPLASAAARQAAVQQCELEARTLGEQGRLTARVQRELGYRASGYPTLEQMAGPMGMTARTLRRRLEEEGTRYSILLDAARLRDAVLLLDNPALDIARVAELLGYNDAANFTRAFRKWTGKVPSRYRASVCEFNRA